MRADRLLNMLVLLQNQGKMTTEQLASQMGVSSRTVIRDMEALAIAGIPIYSERGPQGGWMLSEGYRTRLTGMTQREVLSLLLLQPSGQFNDLGMHDDFEHAFQKLMAASPASLREYAGGIRERLHIDGTAWFSATEKMRHWPTVQEAVWNNRRLSIRHAGKDESFEGVVEPLGLVAKRSIWYMVARAAGEGNADPVVFFRVSRLQEATLLEATFERPADFDLSQYWVEAAERYSMDREGSSVHIKVREAFYPTLTRERGFRLRDIQPACDGWVELWMDFRNHKSAWKTVIGYGLEVQVIAPEELRQVLRDTAEGWMQMYKE
ncbi:helix-turn-helix transcriptional regulator [Paenibacillus solisilvae]|uniref:Helix-turn-helix transcriptional regulator n=1 Tax=Paenibacillus solisilvae TaxID=2486751 RepID=A0ABW0W0E9_9BACL